MSTELAAPLLQPYLFGHAAMRENWLQAFAEQKLHHGLIISGPKGVGKATLAYQFLKDIFSIGKNRDQVVKQLEAGSFPGLLTIERLYDEKRQRYFGDITVDAIEPIFSFLRLSQIDDGYRAIVIDGADTMNRNAQNAILKLLEEPPRKVFFMLLTEQAGLMLPTIRSRCMSYALAPLDRATFGEGFNILSPGTSDAETEALYQLSNGALGQALRWQKDDILSLYGELLSALQALSNGQSQPAMKWAETYAPAAQESAYDMLETLMQQRMRDIARARHTGSSVNALHDGEQAMLSFWATQPADRALKACQVLQSLFSQTDRSHLDRKLTLLYALEALAGRLEKVAPARTAR